MEISIRRAVDADLPAVSTILDHAVSSKMFQGDLAWGDKAYDNSALTEAIKRGTLYVTESGNDGIVGTFRLEPEDIALWGKQPSVAVYVQRFATADGFRGQKLGASIFDAIAELVKVSNLQFIRLICPAKNEKLARYHESNGFTRADFKAKPLSAGPPVVYYERPVDPNYKEPQSTAKRGLLHRLRRRS